MVQNCNVIYLVGDTMIRGNIEVVHTQTGSSADQPTEVESKLLKGEVPWSLTSKTCTLADGRVISSGSILTTAHDKISDMWANVSNEFYDFWTIVLIRNDFISVFYYR